MTARPPARPLPPYDINIIPDLSGLDAFQVAEPQPLPNLPDPIQNVEPLDGYRFSNFLVAIRRHNIEMWEKDRYKRVVNVSAVGRKVFLSIGKIVAGIHKKRQFAGNLIDRIRIYEDQSVNFPFPNRTPIDETELKRGILTDLIHFRWMVARVIVTSLISFRLNLDQLLSDTFKLFFSEIYIHHSDKYSIFQLLHPIFFDASDRMSFLQLILDYIKENPSAMNGLQHLDRPFFNFQKWWQRFPQQYEPIFIRVYKHNNKHKSTYRWSSTLPLFIRNMHHHYAERRQRQMRPTHEEIDRLLHRTFPGVCEVIVDGQIRRFHYDWENIPPEPNPSSIFYRSLAQYFITKPYPFTVEPYRYNFKRMGDKFVLQTVTMREDLGTEYLVRPVARAEDEEDDSDFEPKGNAGKKEEIDEEDEDKDGGKVDVTAKRKRSNKDDSDDNDDGGEDDERPFKR